MRSETEVLLSDLRTREAAGEGTDVRLVLLEAVQVQEQIAQLTSSVFAAVTPEHCVLGRLTAAWEGIELEEHTTRLREVQDLLHLLLP